MPDIPLLHLTIPVPSTPRASTCALSRRRKRPLGYHWDGATDQWQLVGRPSSSNPPAMTIVHNENHWSTGFVTALITPEFVREVADASPTKVVDGFAAGPLPDS